MTTKREIKVKTYRRHPAQVTADRIGNAFQTYYDKMDEVERDAMSLVINALDEIANGTR